MSVDGTRKRDVLMPCPFGSAGRFRPAVPALAPPLAPRPTFGADLNLVTGPLVGSGALFAVDRNRGLVCLDPASGEELWSVATERGWGECLLDGDRVIATPRAGRVAIIDPASGRVLDDAEADGLVLRSAVVHENRVVGPLADGSVAAWDLGRHEFAWRGSSTVRADVPVAAEGGVLVAVEGPALIAYSIAVGEQLWRFDVSEVGRRETIADGVLPGEVATRVVVHNGLAWAGLSGGSFVAVGLRNGELRWHAQLGWFGGLPFELTPDGALVLFVNDELVALDSATGEQRRRALIHGAAPLQPPFAPMALSAGFAWAVDRQGRLTGVDLTDGTIAYQAETRAFVYEPPVITDHALYVTDFDGRLHVYVAQGRS
jgi:outer membrane protein assembly factor BamB